MGRRPLSQTDYQYSRWGLIYGLGAYGLWGVIPLYFRILRRLPPIEILAHRVIWSFVLLSCVAVVLRRLPAVARILRSPRVMGWLLLSTVLIAVNWFTYIFAVSVERVIEASLGYFITPLVNVLLGVVFLKERLRIVQLVSLGLAAAGVINLAIQGRGVPWIAIVLAVSFACYGLIRKTVAADAMLGLYIETLLLTPPALLLLTALGVQQNSVSLSAGPQMLGLLVMTGLLTTVPLLLFAAAARRLRMATLGFLQYISPSVQFVLAVIVFDEPFSPTQLTSFCCIWAAVGLFSIDSYLAFRQQAGLTRNRQPAKSTNSDGAE